MRYEVNAVIKTIAALYCLMLYIVCINVFRSISDGETINPNDCLPDVKGRVCLKPSFWQAGVWVPPTIDGASLKLNPIESNKAFGLACLKICKSLGSWANFKANPTYTLVTKVIHYLQVDYLIFP